MTRSWSDVVAEHTQVIAELASQDSLLDDIAAAILVTFNSGGRVYIAGNGGSAADAQHIAAELVGRFKQNRRALPAIALTTDTSALTAIGNDLGYENVFARQLEAFAQPNDLLWVLSTSGNSPNILRCVDAARERKVKVIGFTGATGGELANRCDWLFRVPHTSSDRIQEAHLLAYHFLCERVEAAVTAEEAATS